MLGRSLHHAAAENVRTEKSVRAYSILFGLVTAHDHGNSVFGAERLCHVLGGNFFRCTCRKLGIASSCIQTAQVVAQPKSTAVVFLGDSCTPNTGPDVAQQQHRSARLNGRRPES